MVFRVTFLFGFASAVVGCLATGPDVFADDAGEGGGEPAATACFPLEDSLYRLTEKACKEQMKWSIPAACVGGAPPVSQCAPLERMMATQGDERYFCCCDPARSDTCDFNVP